MHRRNADGYVIVAVPKGTSGAWTTNSRGWKMYEHRLVMQNFLGRPLRKTETIHHINGVRHDNRLENLELRSGQHGPGATTYTKEIVRLKQIIEILVMAATDLAEKQNDKS